MDTDDPIRGSALVGLLKRFERQRTGAVAPLLAIICLILIGCMGIAIDTGRSMVVKARLVDALDAAGLAVGARIATSDYTADAKKFVAANFKANYAGATVTSVTATPNADKSVITLAATATMPTAFMKLFGTKTVTVNASTEVTRAVTGLEVVMVLDNTGSMEQSSSMGTLKSSANSLVDILFGDKTTVDNLYVGLVPFSQAVNIGSDRTGWVTADSLKNPKGYPGYWTGCVQARGQNLDKTDDPPADTSTKFTSYYAPDDDTKVGSAKVNDWISDAGKYDIYYGNYNDQRGPGKYCPSPVTFLTNQKATITSGISAMKPGGSTMINLGAIWGWRMLSPRWRGKAYWSSATLPLDYDAKNMQKAVVLMTDGENSFGTNNYTAYGYSPGAEYTSALNSALDERLKDACASMKKAGISVYTVAFNNPETATKTLLQNCATSTSFYFDAGDKTALTSAFQTIGSSLSKLRVSK